MRLTYSVHHHFDAAHHLPDYDGKCQNMHGHRWEVDVILTYNVDILPENGMLIDFAAVKAIVDHYDHTVLNTLVDPPTAEMVAAQIRARILHAARVFGDFIPEVVVTVWESPECGVTVEA